MTNEQTKGYLETKAFLIRQGWEQKAAALEAYRRTYPPKGE